MHHYYFHGRFSVLSALRSPFKLKIFNYSTRYYSESIIHKDSMIEVIVQINCFIPFNYDLVHYDTPSWSIDKGEHFTNTRALFTIVEMNYQCII